MKDLLLTLLHLAVTAAKLCGPGGVRAVIAENLLEFARFPVRRHAEWPGVTGRVTVVTTIGPPDLNLRICRSRWRVAERTV